MQNKKFSKLDYIGWWLCTWFDRLQQPRLITWLSEWWTPGVSKAFWFEWTYKCGFWLTALDAIYYPYPGDKPLSNANEWMTN